jgi:hypothetical protein
MDGADAAVDQRFDRRIGVVGTARIMRIVDYAGNACVNAADGRQVVGDIVVLRTVRLGKRKMGRVAIVGKRRRIGIDAAQLGFPGMPVAVDKPGHNYRILRVDHLRARGIQLRGDGSDFLAFDQQVPSYEIADLRVHADDGAALQQDEVRRVYRGLAFEAAQVFCLGGIGENADGRRPRRKCSARLQCTPPCEARDAFHAILLRYYCGARHRSVLSSRLRHPVTAARAISSATTTPR